MKFTISQEVFQKLPGFNVVALIAREINNQGENQRIQNLLRQEEDYCRNLFSAIEFNKHPNIACWQKALSSLRKNPCYLSSVEVLTQRVIKGNQIPQINKLVDLYNLVSLKHLVPIAGDNLKRIKGNIELILASGDENFGQEKKSPSREEAIYVDQNNEVLCQRFNWNEPERTQLTPQTTQAFIVIEGFPPVNDIEVKETSHNLNSLIKKFCGGKIELYLLNQRFPEINF